MSFSKYNEPNESVGLIFWQVHTLWSRKIKEVLNQINLTHTQFVLLAVVYQLMQEQKEITQADISNFSMIDVMTVSSTIRLLGKKEYIKRTQHSKDTRAMNIQNTKKGNEMLFKANKLVEEIDTLFFFTDNPKKISSFSDLLLTLKNDNKTE